MLRRSRCFESKPDTPRAKARSATPIGIKQRRVAAARIKILETQPQASLFRIAPHDRLGRGFLGVFFGPEVRADTAWAGDLVPGGGGGPPLRFAHSI